MLRCCRPRGRAGLNCRRKCQSRWRSIVPTGTRATASTVQTQRSKQTALAAAMTSTLRSVWVGEEGERERLSTLTHSTTWVVVSEFVMRIWLRSMQHAYTPRKALAAMSTVASLGYRRGSTVISQRRCTANVATHTVVRPVVIWRPFPSSAVQVPTQGKSGGAGTALCDRSPLRAFML
jgi:hypothetical protein